MSNESKSTDGIPPDAVKKKKKIIKPKPVKRFRRRASDNRGGTASTWLLSFTDVMALMLTFFVMMFSMSTPKHEEWQQFSKKVQENFNRFEGKSLNRGSQDAISIDRVNLSRALNLNYLQAIITNSAEKEPLLKNVQLIPNGDSLMISLPQNMLFEAGQANIKEEGAQALFALSATLSRIKNRIEVVGNTDPRPITGGEFSSNWELSLARAANVAAVLENLGYKRDITIRGHASARFEDLPVSMSMQERLDLSRRVDIVVMEDDGKRLQLFDLGLPTIK